MDFGNHRMSHGSEPSNQFAAITTTTLNKQADGKTPRTADDPARYTYSANGQMDALIGSGADIPFFTLIRALYIGTGGTLIVQDHDGVPVTFVNVPSGGVLSIRPKQLMAGTTAANIVPLR